MTAGIYPSNTEYYEGGLKVFADYVHSTSITIDKDVVLACGNSIFITKEKTLTASDLDTGTAFVDHTDYYIYICDPSNGDESSDVEEEYKISLNSTYPEGYNESNSRKIGGFYYGRCRIADSEGIPINTSGVRYGSGWISNVYLGIMPNSVWTLLHRPKCDPTHMVQITDELWSDIHFGSDDGNYGLLSLGSANPMVGSFLKFTEKVRRVGKSIPSVHDFIMMGRGSPPGADNNTNARTKSDNSAMGSAQTVANDTSSYNVHETTGNVHSIARDIFEMQTKDAAAWKSVQSSMQASGINAGSTGDLYANGTTSVVYPRVSGAWSDSTHSGPRTILGRVEGYIYYEYNNTGVICICKAK